MLGNQEAGPLQLILSFLEGGGLTSLDWSHRSWREMPQWSEHWYRVGVQEFGSKRRLVPPGRFERFDEAMLQADVDWRQRYRLFSMAARCPSIEQLREAVVRIVHSTDLENYDLMQVRQRLAEELNV